MKSLKLLWNYMDGNRLTYLGAILSVGLAALFAITGPLVTRITIDSIIGDQPLTAPFPLLSFIEGYEVKQFRQTLMGPRGVVVDYHHNPAGTFYVSEGQAFAGQ